MHQLSHQHQHEQQHPDKHQPHYHIHEPTPQQLQQQHHQHHQHSHHQQQQQQQPQRKHHSHSPYHSRHTSPHSQHSHSLHTSPHQSHHHVHECIGTGTGTGTGTDSRDTPLDSPTARNHQHAITANSSQSSHHHHHHRRRKRQYNHHSNGGSHSVGGGGAGSGNSSGSHGHSHQSRPSSLKKQHSSSCTRRHRSATDVSTTSINTCHEPLCTDREVQEIMVRKTCCTSSRTELAQYFAEDLYGSTRRPSSCCTSSDYCYHTDSTSLYGSRSSLSRNNSIKSASVAMRKKRTLHQRQPSYTSISLRGLNASHPNSQLGSLTSIFDRAKQISEKNKPVGTVIVSPSKVTIERQSSSSKDALNEELPDYACSPSPIRWSFLADGKSPTEFEGAVGGGTLDSRRSDGGEYKRDREHQRHIAQSQSKRKLSYDERPSTSSGIRKSRDSPYNCDFEESTTVLFHQEGEAFNNCCNNYIQCNTYLDQDLQITSEDIHQYLSKGNRLTGDILNNSKSYPFQPSNALEFQYKNNFANNNPLCQSEASSGDGTRGFEGRAFRRNSSKETNLNQNAVGEVSGCVGSSCASTPLSPTNINLSSSSNNINIVFNSYTESNANEVKFINTTRESREVAVSSEAHHSGYLPYTYPTYDYTNMSANSLFDKPIGIDEIPNNADCAIGGAGSSASDQHSSSLHSPVTQERTAGSYAMDSFESFDAASDNHLLSQRSSCQFSPQSPRSPMSPTILRSPATSSISATIDPTFQYQYYQQHRAAPPTQSPAHEPQRQYHHQHRHHHHHHHHQSREHFTESFKISQAFKRVRKRARKYTDFLRKK